MFISDKNRRLQNYQNAHETFFPRKCTTEVHVLMYSKSFTYTLNILKYFVLFNETRS